jgi:hypothetical protein
LRRFRPFLIAGIAIIAVPVSFGLATSMSSSTDTLASNNVAVGRCETDGITVLQNLSGGNIVSVTLGQIASACGNGSLNASVNNGLTSSTGSGTVPAGGGSLTVTFGTPVAPRDAVEFDVAISGP